MEDDSGKRKATIPSREEPPDKKLRTSESVKTIYSQSQTVLDNWSSEKALNVNETNVPASQSQYLNKNAEDTSDSKHENTRSSPARNESREDIRQGPDDADENRSFSNGTAVGLSVRKNGANGNANLSIGRDGQNQNRDEAGKKIKWDCGRHFSDQNDQGNGESSSEERTDDLPAGAENNPTAETIVTAEEPPRNKCAYGTRCFRRNSDHKKRFSHPGDPDYDIPDTRPECPYGIKCYRKNPQHKRDFKHTNMRPCRAQTPIRGTASDATSGTEHSSAEESVDESDYEPSNYGGTSDEYRSDFDAFSDLEGISDGEDDK